MMENLSLGLSTALIGMIVVFAGLVILILCIVLLNRVSGLLGKKKKHDQVSRPAERPGAPVPESKPQAPSFDGIDPGVIAAISAAVACMLENGEKTGETEADGFIVRRIVRLQNAPAWQKSGREEQTYSHI